MNDITGPSIEVQQTYWDERWGRQRSPNAWQIRRGETILDMLRSLPLENPRILDLGCATGWMANRLSELGSTEGLDLSEAAITMARAQFPGIRFRAGDLYESSLTDDPVDIVVCQEVIAHVGDQPRLVARIAEVTRPGGYLVMTAANKFVMDRIKDEDGIVGVGPADPDAHIKQWLDMKGLRHLLKPHFRVIRTTSIIPIGHRGVLSVVNSHKLNRVVGRIISPRWVEALKERMGLGYSIIALGQKRP